ncbi:MAG: 23S rRNA (adenine(2030)-N(6))-methyltransferase RlmJ, partial [Hyphomicrobiaceae bacterium]
HLILVLVIEHLKLKPAPFRVIDTHAGIGMYDLMGEEAGKTQEWQKGIGRLIGPGAEPIPADIAPILEPYLALVRAENPSDVIERYPGSPWIARRLLRPGDQLVATELHPDDFASLKRLFGRDKQAKIIALDGWLAPRAFLPPKERRGVVLLDPPFEETGDLERLADALTEGTKRFAQGIFLAWYPIKAERPARALEDATRRLKLPKVLLVETRLSGGCEETRLNGAGLLIVNPPWTLATALRKLLPFLATRLADGKGARFRLEQLGLETR